MSVPCFVLASRMRAVLNGGTRDMHHRTLVIVSLESTLTMSQIFTVHIVERVLMVSFVYFVLKIWHTDGRVQEQSRKVFQLNENGSYLALTFVVRFDRLVATLRVSVARLGMRFGNPLAGVWDKAAHHVFLRECELSRRSAHLKTTRVTTVYKNILNIVWTLVYSDPDKLASTTYAHLTCALPTNNSNIAALCWE